MSSPQHICVVCPHCGLFVIVYVKDYNCKIFRHGAYKDDPTKQIPAHLPKVECDRLKAEDKIYGCGKPFELVNINGIEYARVCDYI